MPYAGVLANPASLDSVSWEGRDFGDWDADSPLGRPRALPARDDSGEIMIDQLPLDNFTLATHGLCNAHSEAGLET
jgi:hypothetical protein